MHVSKLIFQPKCANHIVASFALLILCNFVEGLDELEIPLVGCKCSFHIFSALACSPIWHNASLLSLQVGGLALQRQQTSISCLHRVVSWG